MRDLGAADPARRRAAIAALASDPAPAVSDAIARLLGDVHVAVRLEAARRLVERADERAVAVLVAGATEGNDRLAWLDLVRLAPDLTPRLRTLCERLAGDREASMRMAALEILVAFGIGPSLPVVASLADDESSVVRARAVRSLGNSGDPGALATLVLKLADPDRNVRIETIRALGQLGDARAEPALVRRLASHAGSLEEVSAATALGRLAQPVSTTALLPLARRRPVDPLGRAAIAALGRCARGDGLAALAAMLNEPAVAADAALALTGAGRAAVPALVEALDDDRAPWAARILATVGDDRAIAPLVRTVEGRGRASVDAARALVALHAEEAAPTLALLATDRSVDLRRVAFELLADLADARAAMVIGPGLGDADPQVRRLACALAARLRHRGALPGLAAALADGDTAVRAEAVRALAALGVREAVAPLLSALERSPADAPAIGLALLASADATVAPELVARLARENERASGGAGPATHAPRAKPEATEVAGVRLALWMALSAAAAAGPVPDHPGLRAALTDAIVGDDPSAGLAADVVAALADDGFNSLPLAQLWDAATPAVRARLVPALARAVDRASPRGHDGARRALIERLARALDHDEAESVRIAAAWALAGTPQSELAAARQRLAAPASGASPRLRRAAALAHPGMASARVRVVTPDGAVMAWRWLAFRDSAGREGSVRTDGQGVASIVGVAAGPVALSLDRQP